MNKFARIIPLPEHQRGAVSLLVALVVLASITTVILYTSRTVVMEQKVSSNDYRSRMAFEAAEAGAEEAIAYIQGGRDRDADGLLPAGVDTSGNDVSDADEFLFDTDATPGNDSNTLLLDNGARAIVTLQDISQGDITSTEVVSVGMSDDNVATRTVTQIVTMVNALPNIPENPLLTRGTAVVSGSADVYNPEGHSTIWSGGPVDLGSSATINTYIANPADAGYPNCLGDPSTPCAVVGSSSSGIAGLDVVEQDTSLNNLTQDEFFENFFGVLPTDYRNSVVTMDLDPAVDDVSAAIHMATNPEVIWVDGDVDIAGGTVVGCLIEPTGNNHCTGNDISPVIMVVNGTLTLSGNFDFNGLLFVMDGTSGHGNPYLTGAIIIGGDTSTLTGSFEVHYNSAVLRMAGQGGRPASSGGSWRDF